MGLDYLYMYGAHLGVYISGGHTDCAKECVCLNVFGDFDLLWAYIAYIKVILSVFVCCFAHHKNDPSCWYAVKHPTLTLSVMFCLIAVTLFANIILFLIFIYFISH